MNKLYKIIYKNIDNKPRNCYILAEDISDSEKRFKKSKIIHNLIVTSTLLASEGKYGKPSSLILK